MDVLYIHASDGAETVGKNLLILMLPMVLLQVKIWVAKNLLNSAPRAQDIVTTFKDIAINHAAMTTHIKFC